MVLCSPFVRIMHSLFDLYTLLAEPVKCVVVVVVQFFPVTLACKCDYILNRVIKTGFFFWFTS